MRAARANACVAVGLAKKISSPSVTSFAATTNDTIWMTLRDPATGKSRFVRADWNAAGGGGVGVWDSTENAELDVNLYLVAPNSTVVNDGFGEFP